MKEYIIEIHRPNEIQIKTYIKILKEYIDKLNNKILPKVRVYLGISKKECIREIDNSIILLSIELLEDEDTYFGKILVPEEYTDDFYEGRGRLIPITNNLSIVNFDYIWKGSE